MPRLPEAVDYAIARLEGAGDASLREAMHELGISSSEAQQLVREVVQASDSVPHAAGLGVYLGILIGKGMGR